jgi:hypothetical protein
MVSSQSTIYVAVNHIEVYQHLKNVKLLGHHGQYHDSLCAGQSGDQIPMAAKFSTLLKTSHGGKVARAWH